VKISRMNDQTLLEFFTKLVVIGSPFIEVKLFDTLQMAH
jgi:hypothetical protein